MRKGLTIFALLVIILVVLAEAAVPQVISRTLETRLRETLSTNDAEVSLSTHPGALLLLGQVDALQAVTHQAKVGQVYVKELSLTGQHVHIDMPLLLEENKLRVTRAQELKMQGIIDEENLREVLARRVDKIENVQVKITPERVLVTAEAKVLGRKAEAELSGQVVEDSGSLYFRMEHLSLRNSRLGHLKLEGLFGDVFGDVLLAKPDKIPLGMAVREVRQLDGAIAVSAEWPQGADR